MKILFILLTTMLGISALADIIPVPGSQRLRPVFDSSDLVCYCTIESVDVIVDPAAANGINGWVRQRARAVVDISAAYKQDRAVGRKITVEHDQDVPRISALYSIFQKGDVFLLFLKSSASGEYRLTDTFMGATHFSSLPQVSPELGIEKLQDALTAEATQSNRNDAVHALQLLEGIDDPTERTLSAMEALSASADPEIAFTSISVEMNSKRPYALRNLVSYLNGYRGNAEPWALTNIGTKVAQFGGDQAAPLIQELTRSKYTSIRDGAMRALRARKDPQTARALVDRLDDPDHDVQYLAVITLNEIFDKNGDYGPSMMLFDKKPQYYIALWKQWWADEGSKLYPPELSSK